MTKITVFKNQNGDIFGFDAVGHTDDSSFEGEDVYCAYISALTQTAANGLECVAGVKTRCSVGDGSLRVRIGNADACKIECRTILKTLVLGLNSFDDEYPGYIQIFEEVQ